MYPLLPEEDLLKGTLGPPLSGGVRNPSKNADTVTWRTKPLPARSGVFLACPEDLADLGVEPSLAEFYCD